MLDTIGNWNDKIWIKGSIKKGDEEENLLLKFDVDKVNDRSICNGLESSLRQNHGGAV